MVVGGEHNSESISDRHRFTHNPVNEVPPDMRIFADAWLLGQVFQNLLSNAIRFTPNGKIKLGARNSAGMAQCWVQDTGAGIDRERLDKIFEKLETDQQPEKRGVGLGWQ
jgi:signal transduction histidine kinase